MLSGCGVETTIETLRQGIVDDSGDLVAGEWRRHRRLGGRGLKTTVET